MASFNRADYRELFERGAELYETGSLERVRQIATQLMAMAENCIGQQAPRPHVRKQHQHLTVYPIKSSAEVLDFRTKR